MVLPSHLMQVTENEPLIWSRSFICHVSKQLRQNPIQVYRLCMHAVPNNKVLDFLFNPIQLIPVSFATPISLILLIVLVLSFISLQKNTNWPMKDMALDFQVLQKTTDLQHIFPFLNHHKCYNHQAMLAKFLGNPFIKYFDSLSSPTRPNKSTTQA